MLMSITPIDMMIQSMNKNGVCDTTRGVLTSHNSSIERAMHEIDPIKFPVSRKVTDKEKIQFIYSNLPGAKYVTDQLVGFIFSTKLKTDNEAEDERLQKFLDKKNIEGHKNLDILRNTTLESFVYGEAGLRFLSEEDGLVNVPFGTYLPITVESEDHWGVEEILYYAIETSGKEIGQISDEILEEIRNPNARIERDSNGVMRFENSTIIVIDKELFISIENVPVTGIKKSPLLNDIQRIELLINSYRQLNSDVVEDGPGRIVTWMKDATINDVGVSVHGNFLGQNATKFQERIDEFRNVGEQMMKKLKGSKSTDAIVLNDFFSENIMHLPRTTKATEMLPWLIDEIEIVCQLYGMPPQLLGAGRILGNISMEMIINNSLINVVVPLRHRYGAKVSQLLQGNLVSGEIQFHAENYEDKGRYEDAATLGLLVERLARAELPSDAKAITDLIMDILHRSKYEHQGEPTNNDNRLRNLFRRKRKDGNETHNPQSND